jgi:hypothetical protein
LQGKSQLGNLETVLNFEKFDKPKTVDNVSQWMDDSFEYATIQKSDLVHLAADGASNAIGAISEYESTSRTSRSNDVFFNICYAHQTNRSGGYASGTIKFAEAVNEELGDILNKNHAIQVRFQRSGTRMKVFRDVQSSNGRKPLLSPNPAGDTRWGGFIEETVAFNKFAGDMSEANAKLLSPGGDDYNLLSAEEKEAEDTSSYAHTEEDKVVLRMFEGASAPTMSFLKFTQDNKNAFSYVLFQSRLAIAQSREDSFAIVPGK